MSIVFRSAKKEDANRLYDLARQFTLLNLPADRGTLSKMLEESEASFAQKLPPEDGLYIFVAEDTENELIVASSLIHGRCGTKNTPNYSYRVKKKNLFSEDLGIGFIHQVLSLQAEDNGPTEIGGLLVDKAYRRRPEKIGKQISYMRFCYIALHQHLFTDQIHVELAPPLGEGGRSEFWEALGRRFTGLPYWEADQLSQENKEFIRSLFPAEDIYLSLLDSKARLVLGRVGQETRPAQHMLESIGFKYIDEVDPFDGGPHYRGKVSELLPIKQGKVATVAKFSAQSFSSRGIIGAERDGGFVGGMVSCSLEGDRIDIAPNDKSKIGLEDGKQVFFCPVKD